MRKYVSINPFNNKLIKEYNFLTSQELQRKIDLSYNAHQQIKQMDRSDRIAQYLKLANLIETNADTIAKLISTEMGMAIAHSKPQVNKAVGYIRYLVENYDKFINPERVKTAAKKSLIMYEPIGPIFQLVPFNYPFWLIFKSALPSLLLGNTILSRPSETTASVSLLTEKLFRDCGFDEGVFQTILSSPDHTEMIISDKRVRGVSFTGSTRVGSIIGGLAGKHIKPAVLELGGNDPFIVLPDGDLDVAVQVAAASRVTNAGQTCFSAKRFIVHDQLKVKFIDKLIQKLSSVKMGDPLDQSTELGPLAKQDGKENLVKQLHQAIDVEGAKLLHGGKPIALKEQNLANSEESLMFLPTVIDISNVKNSLARSQEIFGPVFSIMQYENVDEAIKIANDSEYGLGGIVIGKDVDKAEEVCKKLEVGMSFINSPVASFGNMPSGGVKNSGYGRECGRFGFESFSNIKLFYQAQNQVDYIFNKIGQDDVATLLKQNKNSI